MLRSLLFVACCLAQASALVISPAPRASAVRSARPQMKEVVRVEVEVEQGEPCAAPPAPPSVAAAPWRCSRRRRIPGPAGPARRASRATAAALTRPHRAVRRLEKALRRFRKITNVSGHLRLLRNRRTFESAHDRKIRKQKESLMRQARARRSARSRMQ